MAWPNIIQMIKQAAEMAAASGVPHIVVQAARGQIIVMRDGRLHGAKFLERCLP